jgi:transposase
MKRYGADKLCRVLNDWGITCSIKRVQRHMKLLGIRSAVVKKYNHKANHGKVPDNKGNILKRD